MASGGRVTNCMQSSSLYNRGFCDPWTWGSVEKTGLVWTGKKNASSWLKVIWKKSVTENGLFFEKLGIDKFSAAGESTTVFVGWPSASKNISKSPWLRNGTMKRKRKFIKWALIWCASITAEKLVNIFKTFLKFGYLSLRPMGLYLPSCTLYIEDGGCHYRGRPPY